MKFLVAASIALAAGWLTFLGCSEKPVRAPSNVTEIAIATAAPSSSAAHSASAAPLVPAGSASAQSDADAPASDAALAPGQIACGKAICKAGRERCCPARGACEVIGDSSDPKEAWPCEAGNAYRCDSRDDCGKDERCCWFYGDPAAVTLCTSGGCPETEACRGPAGCAEGFVCKKDGRENDPGTCTFASPRTQCGTTTCSGAKPVCRWNTDSKKGTCVDSKEAEPSDEERDVKCASRADCGGENCCSWGARTWCGGCGNNSVACKTKADCPRMLGGGQKLTGCVDDGIREGAPWLRVCEYSDPTPMVSPP